MQRNGLTTFDEQWQAFLSVLETQCFRFLYYYCMYIYSSYYTLNELIVSVQHYSVQDTKIVSVITNVYKY